jgi:cytochrome P450
MANAHAITHDPSVYAEPDRFNPDRYIPTSEGGAGEPLPVSQFGFGRRYILLRLPSQRSAQSCLQTR